MSKNESIYALSGDLGYIGFDQIEKDFPTRYINTGATEQSLIGMAVGLALKGKIPIVYSITNFLLYRPYETIRNYIDYEKIPVKLVGSGRNKDYEHDGISHWSEDAKKVLVNFPNIVSLWPETKEEIPTILEDMIHNDKPTFLSLKR
jgi:transketolase